ncbi:MAG: rod shape-determining protein MreD [Clostridia bacterium]|nr:rod shape-determining protein MreD [Clostridia bacterium]
MRYLVLSLLGFFALILQSTILNEFTIAGVKPDLLLIFTVYFALIKGPGEGAGAGFLLGLIEDLYSAKYIGLNALCKLIIGILVGFLEKRLYKENFFVPMMALFVASLLHTFLYFVFSNFVGYPIPIVFLAKIILPFALYNTCLTPFIYGLFYKACTYKN